MSRLFTRAIREAGLPHIRMHDLRHGFATLALAAGVNPKVVSDILGHATVSFTLDTYSHAMPALEEQAVNRLARLVDSQTRAKDSFAIRLHEPPKLDHGVEP